MGAAQPSGGAMKQRTSPCKRCPFRTDLEPYLRKARAEEIRDNLEGGGVFHCHETVDYSGDEERVTDESEVCAGSLILMEHQGGAYETSNFVRILTRIGCLDLDKLNLEAPVFRDWDGWIDAQEVGS